MRRKHLAIVAIAVAAAASLWVSRSGTESPEVPRSLASLDEADPNPSPEPPLQGDDLGGLRFVVLGDFGTGEAVQGMVAQRMCAWRQRRPFDLVVTTGDNVYPDGAEEHFESKFFEPYECLLSNGVTFRASLGNHDIATDGGLPELREPAFGMTARNYVFRQAGIRFVMVDSNEIDLDWIAKATRSGASDRWTIVAFHHPVYSGGDNHGSTPGFAEQLTPLFEKNGVDLVLNGHDHVYSVTEEVGGIRYVVTGGGGARAYGCAAVPLVVKCVSRPHFLEVSVSQSRIVVRAVPPAGRPFHRFTTDGL